MNDENNLKDSARNKALEIYNRHRANHKKKKKHKKSAAKKRKQQKKRNKKKADLALGMLKVIISNPLILVMVLICGALILGIISYLAYEAYTNTDGASKNYATISKNVVSGEYDESVDENGRIIRKNYVTSLSTVNAAIASYYDILSKKSFYQISMEDGKTLICGDDEKYQKDYYNREKYLTLNPDFIYSLDNTMIKDSVYPEQFIKPVPYDEATMKIQDILGEENNLNILNNQTKQTETNLTNYGFGSVSKYLKTDIINVRRWKFYKQEVWDRDTQQIVFKDIEEYSVDNDNIVSFEKINLIDKICTFAGTISYNYECEETKTAHITQGTSSKVINENTQMYIYDTYTYDMYVGYVYVFETDEDGNKIPELDINGNEKKDINGNVIYKKKIDSSQTEEGEKEYLENKNKFDKIVQKKDAGGNKITVSIELRKYKDEKYSGDYKITPVVSVTNGCVITENVDRRYFNDYLSNFSNIKIPSVSRSYDMLAEISSYATGYSEYLDASNGSPSGSSSGSSNISESHQAFIDKISEAAVEDYKESGILPSITIAQAILESGWGVSDIHNNLFGIKAGSSWTGAKSLEWTHETVNGQRIQVQAWFRNYDSYLDSIKDHSRILWYSRYENLHGEKDYRLAAKYLQFDGYATDPTYAEQLIDVIEKNNLVQYDTMSTWSGVPPSYASDVTGNTSSYTGGNSHFSTLVSYYGSGLNLSDRQLYSNFVNFYENEEVDFYDYSNPAKEEMINEIIITNENFNNGSYKNEVEPDMIPVWDKSYFSIVEEGSIMGELGILLDETYSIDSDKQYDAYIANIPDSKDYYVPIERDIIITSSFSSYRELQVNGKDISGQHKGTDIAGSATDRVLSVTSGKVEIVAHNNSSAGNYVVIANDDGTKCRYLHMSSIVDGLEAGDTVVSGEQIGNVGSTGQSTGPHLHIEWIQNGVPMNMYPILKRSYENNGFKITVNG